LKPGNFLCLELPKNSGYQPGPENFRFQVKPENARYLAKPEDSRHQQKLENARYQPSRFPLSRLFYQVFYPLRLQV
jgi:hypothetical protein